MGAGVGVAGALQEPSPLPLQLFSSRTTWVYSINNVLMSLSGLAMAGWEGGESELKESRVKGLGDRWARLKKY